MINEYLVYHNILSIDKFVFPSGDNNFFLNPETWSKELIKVIDLSKKLCVKHNINLVKGWVNYEKNRTQLTIHAYDENSLRAFYQDFNTPLMSSYNERIEFIEIHLNPQKEIHETLDKLKEVVTML